MANQSFLPEDYLARRVARRTNIICGVLFIIVMLGVVAAFFVTNRQRSEIRTQQLQVNQRFDDAAKRLEQLEKLNTRKAEMIRKARVTSMLVERVPRSLVLAELINHMPDTLGLLELDLDTQTVKSAQHPRTAIERHKLAEKKKDLDDQPEVLPTRLAITLIGVAPTDVEVSTFMSRLNADPMFSDVSLQFSEQVTLDKRTMRKFRIQLEVGPDVDLDKIQPARVPRQPRQNPMGDRVKITPQIDAQPN